MKILKKLIRWVALASFLLLLTACPKPNPPGIVEREPIIPATTKVPDKATRDLLSVYNPDTGIMRFTNSTPLLDSLKTGDVFVGEPSSAAPAGYLRKVNKISKEGAEVILETTQAKLTDAIHQGTLNVQDQLKQSQLKSVTLLTDGAYAGLNKDKQTDESSGLNPQVSFGKGFDFEAGINLKLEAKDSDDGVEGELTANFNGGVKFNVGYTVVIDIGFLADLNYIEASLGFEESVSITIDADAKGKIEKEWEIARFDFDAVKFFIGPVPVVLVPSAKLILGVSGEASVHFDYTFGQIAAFRQGVRWDEDKGWSRIDKNEFKVTREGPNFEGQLNLTAYARANMRVLFYNVAGPDVGAIVGARLDVAFPRDPLWRLYGLVAGDIAFTIDILGENKRFDEELFRIEKEIASGAPKPPVITILNPNPSVDLLFDTDLAQFFTIEDQIGYSYELRSDKGEVFNGSFLNGNPFTKVKFTTAGVRTMTINARSSTGKTAQAFFTINVINTPPESPSLFNEDNLSFSVGQGDEFDLNLNTPNDKNSGILDCATAVRWVVSGTDSLLTENGSSLGCSATATFGTQGTRTVKAIITDPEGLSTERTFNITVGPEPTIKSPKLSEIVVNNGDVKRNGLTYYTVPLTASITVTNPDNVSFSSIWSIINDNPRATLDLYNNSTSVTVLAGQTIDDGQQGPVVICGGGSEAAPAKATFVMEFTALGRTRIKVFDFFCAPVPPK
jgi:hypothetical protein